MAKLKVKRLYVRGLKGKCSGCGKTDHEISVGEYIRAKWNTVGHWCPDSVGGLVNDIRRYLTHQRDYTVELASYQGFNIPENVKAEVERIVGEMRGQGEN